MTAKEKARELVWWFYNTLEHTFNEEYSKHDWEISKQCATKVVDELLHYSKQHGFIGLTEFYEEVKTEIEKL